jgi:hypothetical protein
MSRKFLAIPFAAAVLIAAAPVPSTTAGNSEEGGSSDASQPSSKPAKQGKTCRKIFESGSRIQATRLCMTAAKWREFDERRSQ